MTGAVARKSDGNPEGKGVNGLLLDLQLTRPRGVVAKPQPQVLAELFTSMLVLSSSFKYRPVVGDPNYLYWHDNEWQLSLVAPDEWGEKRRSAFAGICLLQQDMTWAIEPGENLTDRTPVSEAVRRFFEAFAAMLDTDLPLEELLPFYRESSAYYQRLFGNALSRSLEISMTLEKEAKPDANSDEMGSGPGFARRFSPPLLTARPGERMPPSSTGDASDPDHAP